MTESIPTPQGPVADKAEPTSRELLQILLHRWIVLYNPFYFIATLSMLTGVYLIDHGLDGSAWNWTFASMAVLGVLQLFEACLIGLAAWLVRRGLKRPAVILACLESFLLLDPAFFHQVVAHYEPYDTGTAVASAVLTFFKLVALAAALDLRWQPRALVETTLPLTALSFVPVALDNGWVAPGVMVTSIAWLATGWLLLWQEGRTRFRTRASLDAWGRTVLRRFEAVLRSLLPVALLIHAISWIFIFDLPLGIVQLVPPCVAMAWVLRRHPTTCLPLVAALSCSTADDGSLMWTGVALGVVYAHRLWEAPRHPWPALGAGLAFYLAACSVPWNPPVPQTHWAADLFLIAFGIWAAWHTRHLLPAFPGAVLAAIHGLTTPFRPVETGIGFAVFAFVALGLGTWAADRLAREPLPEMPTGPPATDDPPSSDPGPQDHSDGDQDADDQPV